MSKLQQRTAVLISTACGSFLTPYMAASVNIALPSIGRELGMDAVMLSWVSTAYLLSAAVFLLPFGRLADIYGRKKVFFWGIVISTASAFFSALSFSAPMLLVFRVLNGAGASMVFGTAIAILISEFPPSKRGKVIGINVGATYLGLSLGPVLGGFLTGYLGWRSVFYMNVPLGLVVIYAVLANVKTEWAYAREERFDLAGSLIYGVSLSVLIYGLSRLPSAFSGWLLIGAGAIGLLFFWHYESALSSPVFHVGLFRKNSVFIFSNIATLINYSATFGVVFLLSLYLQYIKGFDPRRAGLVMVAQPLTMAVFSPLSGRLSDRFEARIVASAGMMITVVSLLSLTFVNELTSMGRIISSLIILGLGLALFSSPNTSAVMGSVGKHFYGIASATMGTMRLLGQMFSMGISMMVFSIQIGDVKITQQYYPQFISSISTTFWIFTILCAGGVFASLARGKLRAESE